MVNGSYGGTRAFAHIDTILLLFPFLSFFVCACEVLLILVCGHLLLFSPLPVLKCKTRRIVARLEIEGDDALSVMSTGFFYSDS